MQVVYKNEVKKEISRKTSAVDTIIYIGKVSRCVEGKYNKGIGVRRSGI